jgi:hypothetical protein
MWIQHGKPRTGTIAEMMRSSRRDYHYAIRQVRRHETQLKKEGFLKALLQGDRQFHAEVKKLKGIKHRHANTVNGKQSKKDIADEFAVEYKNLFNSCTYESNFYESFTLNLNSLIKCHGVDTNIVNFSTEDMMSAIKHIKFNKSDGVFNLVSDNYKHATHAFYNHVAVLLNACMSHGYIPHCLLLSSLTPIPKDQLEDLSNSQNYRGIALCALCLKVFEYAILLKYNDLFSSSHHQFAYKAKSSTTMCTWTAREVISYYKNKGSEVQACLLDCSKAFDKIRYDILFQKLLEKGIPPIIIRFILYNYTNSQVRVRWNGAESNSFTVCNGVRQGAVLSPFLFNIYIDELIHNLTSDGAGCWVGPTYYGVLVYADDILLLAPSFNALQHMVDICECFGANVGLNFNSKKTICISFHKYGHCSNEAFCPKIFLNGQLLSWCKKVKHLGHMLSCCLSSESDIACKKGSFISCVNNIQAEFPFAHPSIKVKLLQIYGCSFYGSNLWDLYHSSADHLFKTWNIALRRLYGLPYQSHTRFLDNICNVRHVSFTLKVRFVSFVQMLCQSTNDIVRNLIQFYVFNHTSPTGIMLSNILKEFDIGCLSDMPMYSIDKALCGKYNSVYNLPEHEMSFCNTVKELIDCLHGNTYCGLRATECTELIQFLTTV